MFPISLLLFFSGFAALTYEILWLRHLGLIFGNTVHAAATVMTVYMVGLALGAHLAGKYAHRVQRPIRIFGMLELGIGGYAVLVPLLFMAIQYLHVVAYQNISESLSFLTFLRFMLSILLMLLPTCFMGATLPVLSHGLLHRHERFGSRIGLLYGVNTLGAMAGTLSCGFLLIPYVGLRWTYVLVIGINAAVGMTALSLSVNLDRPLQKHDIKEPEGTHYHLQRDIWLILISAGLSGFISLGFEIAWFRALILVFGSTTYSFSAILSVFLVGIALGAMLLSWLADRFKNPLLLFRLALVGIGLYSLASLYWFDAMPELMLAYMARAGLDWYNLITVKFVITFVFLFVPTLFFGAAFAAAARAVRDRLPSASRTVGLVYTINTIGSAAGSVFVGFYLLPSMGMQASLITLGMAALLLGTGLLLNDSLSRMNRSVFALASAGCIALVLLFPPHWDRKIVSEGPYFFPWKFITADKKITFEEHHRDMRLLYYYEGRTSSVSVSKNVMERLYFSTNGKIEADTSPGGMMLQRMMGHLPMLFHPDPRRVLNIGLGAGVTFGALGCYPVDHLEVVEIEPAVKGVARVWEDYNHAIMDDPRAIITINDGRNLLAVTSLTYDVITADPFEPVVAGAANLFTVDYFDSAKSRLAPGGIMAQFLPLYELSEENVLTIMHSFLQVFPICMQFYTGYDTLLLGFKDGIQFDAATLRQKLAIEPVRQSLADLGFSRPEDILCLFVTDLRKLHPRLKTNALNTDAHPIIEFSAPRSALRGTIESNQLLLSDIWSELPQELRRGFNPEEIEVIASSREALVNALQAYARMKEAGSQFEWNQAAERIYAASRQVPQNPLIQNLMVITLNNSANRLARSKHTQNQAYQQYQQVLHYHSKNFWALYSLANVALRNNKPALAKQWIDHAWEHYPEAPLLLLQRGRYHAATNDLKNACADLNAALAALPEKADLWRLYAKFLERKGDANGAAHARARYDELR